MRNPNLNIRNFLIACLLVAFGALNAYAQQFGVKTNLLYDATATVNLGAELSMGRHWSVDVSGNLNAWNMGGDRKWKHWMMQPEVRYWFCEALHGHFVALHGIGGEYNVGHWGFDSKIFGLDFDLLRTMRYQGWAAGGGIGYGYAWMLGKNWNLEAEIGVGYIYSKYDEYKCSGCGKKTASGLTKNYVGPTKLALSLEYIF